MMPRDNLIQLAAARPQGGCPNSPARPAIVTDGVQAIDLQLIEAVDARLSGQAIHLSVEPRRYQARLLNERSSMARFVESGCIAVIGFAAVYFGLQALRWAL